MNCSCHAASDAKRLVMSAGQPMSWPRPPFRSTLGKKGRSTQRAIANQRQYRRALRHCSSGDVGIDRLVTDLEDAPDAAADGHGPAIIVICLPIGGDQWRQAPFRTRRAVDRLPGRAWGKPCRIPGAKPSISKALDVQRGRQRVLAPTMRRVRALRSPTMRIWGPRTPNFCWK